MVGKRIERRQMFRKVDTEMAEKDYEKEDAVAECRDPDLMYTDDDACSSDSNMDDISDLSLTYLLRRAKVSYKRCLIQTKKDSKETPLPGVSNECAAKNAMELVEEEEREKQRVEKRKTRNKRKKEKRKQKKLELNKKSHKDTNREDDINKTNVSEADKVTKHKKKEHLNGDLSKESSEEAVSENGVVEDDFLDLNSAFVTNVANKKKQKSVNESHHKRTMNVNSPADDGEKLALLGCSATKSQQYEEAVNHYTKAINLVNTDCRFYNNRSYCYCKLGQYMKGLKDADKAIQCSPNNPKGYFRRGEALKHLKQYNKAEEAFMKALELDDSIVEARQELDNLKLQQLCDMGFKLHEAQKALQLHFTVQAAVEALTINKDDSLEDEDEIFYSDDEGKSSAIAAKERERSNPLGPTSLWVGNITESVTEFQLIEVFSRYGEIASIKLLPQSFCAFINYKDESAPGRAMRYLQGILMGGRNLVIEFANKAAADARQKALFAASTKRLKVKGPVNSNECYFWRTTGCAFGDKCRYVHIQEHKGIDRKPWHKMSEQ